MTSQTMCSASEGGVSVCSFLFLQMGHLVMSSGHTYGATLAGASQKLQQRTVCQRPTYKKEIGEKIVDADVPVQK